MDRTDEDLLIAAAGGDEAAFVAFYRRHAQDVLGFLQRRTQDPELAADLTAEVFATVLVQARRFRRGGGDGRAWLFAIVRHKQVDAFRRGRAEDAARRRLGMERVEPHADDVAMTVALGSTVETLVSELPPDQRAAVTGRVVEDRSYAELAEHADVSQATVRQRVVRGLATVRTRLEDR